MGKPKSDGAGKERSSVDVFMDDLDEKMAAMHRRTLGARGCLISLTKLDNGTWRTCLSFKGLERMRLVRKGKTRVKAIDNTNKAFAELVALLKGRGAAMFAPDHPPLPSLPE